VVSGARPAKKLATAVPAAPGGGRGDPEPLLDAVTASAITDALYAAFAAGALLAMVADTLLTEAYEIVESGAGWPLVSSG
jgi:hypothetical protein